MENPNTTEHTIEVDEMAMRPGRFTTIGKLRYIAHLFPGSSSVARALLMAANELENYEEKKHKNTTNHDNHP